MSTTIDWIECPYCGYENAYFEQDNRTMNTFSTCPECGWHVENGRELQAGKIQEAEIKELKHNLSKEIQKAINDYLPQM